MDQSHVADTGSNVEVAISDENKRQQAESNPTT